MKNRVSEIARSWVGRDFRPGVGEQCMGFVRAVLEQAGHPLADEVTREPVDGLSTGPMLASSLAGRDLGYPLVGPDDRDQLQPGAILFWRNTYGQWPVVTITHVGIYVGGGLFVHRPTMSRPVEQASLSHGTWSSLLRCALLSPDLVEAKPATPAPAADTRRVRVWGHPGGHRLRLEVGLPAGDYQIVSVSGEGGAAVLELRPRK